LEFRGRNIADQEPEGSAAIVDQILVKELIAKLDTDKERSLFIGYFVEGKRLQELADDLGITKQAVHKQFKKIVEKLKPCVK
jgi:RNA polymerase sigma factor (sigma-70 family)